MAPVRDRSDGAPCAPTAPRIVGGRDFGGPGGRVTFFEESAKSFGFALTLAGRQVARAAGLSRAQAAKAALAAKRRLLGPADRPAVLRDLDATIAGLGGGVGHE